MKTFIRSILLTVFLAAAPAPPPGWDAFRTGDYQQALVDSMGAATADGFALACRTHMVLGGYYTSGDDAVRHLHKALAACQKAIDLESGHIVGRMTYAMASGFEGKRLFRPSYATASRRHLEYLADLYPDDPMTVAAVGGWHSEVGAAGFLARLALGASRKTAGIQFEKALALGDPDIALHLEYVKYLARKGKNYREQAISEVDKLLAKTPDYAFEGLLQEHAIILQAALRDGSGKEIRVALEEIAAFKGIEDWTDLPAAAVEFRAP